MAGLGFFWPADGVEETGGAGFGILLALEAAATVVAGADTAGFVFAESGSVLPGVVLRSVEVLTDAVCAVACGAAELLEATVFTFAFAFGRT